MYWVSFYRYYYQLEPSRLSACPLTIHALLHIADSIIAAGPVWTCWAFPMERYCGSLQRSIRSRRYPYASLNRYVLDRARLTQIKLRFDLADTLSLKAPSLGGFYRAVCIPGCECRHSQRPSLLTRCIYRPDLCPSSAISHHRRLNRRLRTPGEDHRGLPHPTQCYNTRHPHRPFRRTCGGVGRSADLA